MNVFNQKKQEGIKMLKSLFILVLLSFTYFSMSEEAGSSEESQPNVLDLLLEGVEEDIGSDLILLAVRGEDIDHINYIIDKFPQQLEYRDPDTGYTPFLIACMVENMEIMELFLDIKPEFINDVDSDRDSCVHLLVLYGVYSDLNQKIKTLIDDRGADLTMANNDGLTAFLGACKKEI